MFLKKYSFDFLFLFLLIFWLNTISKNNFRCLVAAFNIHWLRCQSRVIIKSWNNKVNSFATIFKSQSRFIHVLQTICYNATRIAFKQKRFYVLPRFVTNSYINITCLKCSDKQILCNKVSKNNSKCNPEEKLFHVIQFEVAKRKSSLEFWMFKVSIVAIVLPIASQLQLLFVNDH